MAAIRVKLDAALTELSQAQEARRMEAAASTTALSVAEAKIQAVEEREATQINKARRHCEELAVSLQETEGSLEVAEARVGELTSKLKESQNARLDLQVKRRKTIYCLLYKTHALITKAPFDAFHRSDCTTHQQLPSRVPPLWWRPKQRGPSLQPNLKPNCVISERN